MPFDLMMSLQPSDDNLLLRYGRRICRNVVIQFFLLLFILVFFCCSGVHISTHLCDMCGVCICRQIYSYVKAIEMRKNWKQYDWFLFLTLSRSLFWCDGFILRWKCGIVFTLAEWVDDWILWWIYKWLMISLEDILGIGTENQVKSENFRAQKW